MLLDELAGPGWCAVATDAGAAEALAGEGLPVLLEGRDFSDSDGGVAAWLGRYGADWVVLRPDRFVFALGAAGDPGAIREAGDALHRQLGRAPLVPAPAPTAPPRSAPADEAVAA